MADQAEVIRKQMADTRASMTEKIEALEQQVGETVSETTETVSETVETATEAVKETVETVSETVEAVKETFNIPGHVERYPWIAFGSAAALGYLIGSLFGGNRQAEAQPTPTPTPPPTPAPQPAAEYASAGGEQRQEQQGGGLFDALGTLKELAVGTAVGLLGKMLLNALPSDLRSGATQMLNQVTQALGGKPLQDEPAREGEQQSQHSA